jgi:hypothetical protein
MRLVRDRRSGLQGCHSTLSYWETTTGNWKLMLMATVAEVQVFRDSQRAWLCVGSVLG